MSDRIWSAPRLPVVKEKLDIEPIDSAIHVEIADGVDREPGGVAGEGSARISEEHIVTIRIAAIELPGEPAMLSLHASLRRRLAAVALALGWDFISCKHRGPRRQDSLVRGNMDCNHVLPPGIRRGRDNCFRPIS